MGLQSVRLRRAALATLAYLITLPLVYLVHSRYFRVDVVFYSALLDVLIATALCALPLWLARGQSVLDAFDKAQLTLIWLLIGYALAISVPTVIDRSLSFYILEKIEQRGGGIRQPAFEGIFTREYMIEHRLVDVRLTEQLASGTIELIGDCVLLTDKGRRIAAFSRTFRTQVLPRRRLLMGEYTSALTDPFRDGISQVDYGCSGD